MVDETAFQVSKFEEAEHVNKSVFVNWLGATLESFVQDREGSQGSSDEDGVGWNTMYEENEGRVNAACLLCREIDNP